MREKQQHKSNVTNLCDLTIASGFGYVRQSCNLTQRGPADYAALRVGEQSILTIAIDRASNMTLGVVDRAMNPRWLLPFPQTAGGETQNVWNSAPSTAAPNGGAAFEFAANLSIIKWTPESADVATKHMRQ